MYIVPIAWMYVVIMMSVAEANSSNGTVLGACITFVLYGALPVTLIVYIMGTPARKRLLREKEQAERTAWLQAQDAQKSVAAAQVAGRSIEPDQGGLAAADPLATVGKEV